MSSWKVSLASGSALWSKGVEADRMKVKVPGAGTGTSVLSEAPQGLPCGHTGKQELIDGIGILAAGCWDDLALDRWFPQTLRAADMCLVSFTCGGHHPVTSCSGGCYGQGRNPSLECPPKASAFPCIFSMSSVMTNHLIFRNRQEGEPVFK